MIRARSPGHNAYLHGFHLIASLAQVILTYSRLCDPFALLSATSYPPPPPLLPTHPHTRVKQECDTESSTFHNNSIIKVKSGLLKGVDSTPQWLYMGQIIFISLLSAVLNSTIGIKKRSFKAVNVKVYHPSWCNFFNGQ